MLEDEGAEPLSDWSLAARELTRRSLRWLSLHEAGVRAERNGGALAPAVELRAQVALDGTVTRALHVECRRDVVKRDPPAQLRLRLQLDELDHVESASVRLVVWGRRKSLRRVARGLRKPFPKSLTATIEQDVEGGKHDPAYLAVAVDLDAAAPVEELISQGLRLLETLVSEAVSVGAGS
jgi:hypothetical protein